MSKEIDRLCKKCLHHHVENIDVVCLECLTHLLEQRVYKIESTKVRKCVPDTLDWIKESLKEIK